MNSYGFIDYEKPIGCENDWRTSTYFGHNHIIDDRLDSAKHNHAFESCIYRPNPMLAHNNSMTDYEDNFDWKFKTADGCNLLPQDHRKVHYTKPFAERQFQFLRRPYHPPVSVTHDDFDWSPPTPDVLQPLPTPLLSAVEPKPLSAMQDYPSYSKHLDPSATTNSLTYVAYSPKQIMGIAANDGLTYWNWKDKMIRTPMYGFTGPVEHTCRSIPLKPCPKRLNNVERPVGHVPHSGMTTEVRDNYTYPNQIEFGSNFKIPPLH